jgi:hypothetical protein
MHHGDDLLGGVVGLPDPATLGLEHRSDDDEIDNTPATRTDRKVEERNRILALKRQAISRFIPELPPPDTDIWIIGNSEASHKALLAGQDEIFELGHFIPVLVERVGPPAEELYISTWGINRDHIETLFGLYDTGLVKRITFVTDRSFQSRHPEVATPLYEGLEERGQRLGAFRNHVKAIAVKGQERVAIIMGSANLSSQPRAENYVLSTAPELYEWLTDEFFEPVFERQEKRARRRT